MLSKDQKNQIEKQVSLSEISKREERYMYYGLLSTYQLHGVKEFTYMKLNSKQHLLFKTVLHGFGAYSKHQVSSMSWEKKKEIKYLWSKGQHVINNFKQQVTSVYANEIFSLFKSKYVKFILDIPVDSTDKDIYNDCTLKDLGINYDDLILLFIKKKLLPCNFLSIK